MTKINKHPNAILAIILTSTLMVVMDVSIVTTALPKIHTEFGFSPVDLSWVANAYSLAFGGLLLLGAKSGDLFGMRKMFIIGLAVFTFASLAVGLAQSAAWLIIARVIQGLGASILSPSTLALLTVNFKEGHERTRVLALYGTIVGIATSVGLVLGGIVTSLISWRVAFFLNVPIGIVLLFAAFKYIAETSQQKGKLDILGALLSTVGMTSLVYGIVHAGDFGWSNSVTIMTVLAGIILLAGFIVNEWKVEDPIMPLRIFKSRGRSGSYSARTLYLGVMISFWFFLTQYLQVVKGFSPILAGIAFLPMTLANFGAAFYIPRLTRRIGNPLVIAVGIGITVVGMIWLSRITAASSYFLQFALPLVLLGIGQGLSQGPLTAEGLKGVANENAGAASGITYVASQLGAALSLAILVTVFAAANATSLTTNELLTHRISASLVAGAVMLALSFVITIIFIVRPSKSA
jgi:EmrB/QacA subfamily drug resistance transporter